MASPLEDFVNNVRSCSNLRNYKLLADQIKDSTELLTRNWAILDNVLETLDIQAHTLGVLYVLIAKISASSKNALDAREMVTLVKNFVAVCDAEQLDHVMPAFFKLCHLFAEFLLENCAALYGIPVLAQAIAKVQQDVGQLTPIHTDLCLLSLEAKHFKVVLNFLDEDVTEISTAHTVSKLSGDAEFRSNNQEPSNEDSKQVLLYLLYGGHIYSAVKNYKRALFFYESCLSVPAMALSEIMIDAYKRYYLLTLITEDAMAVPPKHSPNVITRHVKALVQPYYELAHAYLNAPADEFRLVLYKHREQFEKDNNIGCIKEVSNCYFKRNIRRLTKTFSTMTFTDMASRAQLSNPLEAEKVLRNMIQAGEISGTIDQANGIVVFESNVEQFDSPEMFHQIQEDTARVMLAMKQLNKMEEEIKLDTQYIKKLVSTEDEITNPKVYSSEIME